MPATTTAPRAAHTVHAIEVTLHDRDGNQCDGLIGTPLEAALFAANFLLSQGSDPDADGAGATPGEIRFLPLRTPPLRSEDEVIQHERHMTLIRERLLADLADARRR